eukprot:8561648-Pyramimonas_sp.AAC.1
MSNGVKKFGFPHGVPQVMISRCVSRLRAWVALSLEVVRSEIPDFDVLHLFRIFDLSDASGGQAGDDAMVRLAKAFRVSCSDLRHQFEDVYPIALSLYQASGKKLDPKVCWRDAFARLSDRRIRENHPVDVLRVVLQRYFLFCGCTSSGVEQSFAKVERLLDGRRGCCDGATEDDELRICLEPKSNITEQLLKGAVRIYKIHYKPPRMRGKS